MSHSKKTLVCDIDNTVSNQYLRFERFFDRQTKQLKPQAFVEVEMMNDEPLPGAVEAIQLFSLSHRIIWLSARLKREYEVTRQWLSHHQFPIDELILVETHDGKIPFLRELQPDLFVDDLKYDWEILEPKVKTEYIRKLTDQGIRFEIFENNWGEIVQKHLKAQPITHNEKGKS